MKEDQTKKPSHTKEEGQSTSAWRTMLKKKWFFPAVYLGAAALILALITWYQNPNDYAIDKEDLNYDTIDYEDNDAADGTNEKPPYASEDNAVPVNAEKEEMTWPVANKDNIEVVLEYFDDQASEEEQAKAMVQYDQSYHPSQGMSFAHSDKETSFDVVASLSGKVIRADKDPLMGHYVEIEHDNGLVTVYQSLEGVEVSKGDEVKQGDLIGKAGRNLFQKDLGVHVHFEVRDENGQALNPEDYFTKAKAEQ